MFGWILLLWLLLIFILSSLPLYFAVKFLRGKTTLLKVILVNILVAVVAFCVKTFFNTWGGLIAFIAMIWIYREMFRLIWIKAILAWILQFVFAVLIFLFLVILGFVAF